jgi:hypothetical protein
VIDMVIRSPSNPWPFSHKTTLGKKTIDEYVAQAKANIKEALTKYVPATTGLSPAAVGHLSDATGLNLKRLSPNPKNTRVVASNPATNVPVPFRSITVKIRYDFAYPLAGAAVGQQFIEKIAFEAVRVGTNLQVELNTKVLK